MTLKTVRPLVLLAGFWPCLSLAADPLEEVVVRAGFREVELFHSAGSVSVLDHDALAERAATHLQDTINAFPNVNYSSGGSRARFLQIRGVGDLEQFVDPKHYPSVGIVVDGIELASLASAAVLMDVDQVELLRGPQGTRFGAAALAGLVNVRSRDPTDSFEGGVEAGYGNLDSWRLSGFASGPIGSGVQGRIALQQHRSDGHIKNAFLHREDTHDHDELALRGKLRWMGGTNLQIDITGMYLDLDNGYDAFSLDNTRTTLSDRPGEDSQQSYALAGTATWDASDTLRIEATVSWTDSDEVYGFDEDWVFAGFCDGVRCDPLFEFSSADQLDRDKQQISADLRLLGETGAASWVTGIYAQIRDEDLRRQRFGDFASAYETQRYAVYGEIAWSWGARWQATAGLRLERFEDEYDDSNDLHTGSNDTIWSGQLSLEYAAGPNTLLYATLSRGAKPGGVNTEASSSLPFVSPGFVPFLNERRSFDTEILLNKEFGLKGRYFDERLAVRVAAFHMDRSDAQLESWIWDAANFLFVGMLDSVAEAQNYGLELEFDFAMNDVITLDGSVGYLHTKLDAITTFDLDLMDFTVRRDREQTKAPNWQYNVGVNAQISERFNARVEVEGRGESFFGYYHDAKLNGYTLLNASMSYRLGQTRVRLWSRNLLDKDYPIHGLFFANDPRDGFVVNRAYYQYGEPRVFGVNVSYDF